MSTPSNPIFNRYVSVAGWTAPTQSLDNSVNYWGYLISDYLLSLSALRPDFGSWNQYTDSPSPAAGGPITIGGGGDVRSMLIDRLNAQRAALDSTSAFHLVLCNDTGNNPLPVQLTLSVGSQSPHVPDTATIDFGPPEQAAKICTPALVLGVLASNVTNLGATRTCFLNHNLRIAQGWQYPQLQIGWATFLTDDIIAKANTNGFPNTLVTNQPEEIQAGLTGPTGKIYAFGPDPLNPPLDSIVLLRTTLGYPYPTT